MFWLTPRTGNPPPTAQRTPATLASGTPPEEFRMQTCQRNGDAARDHPGDCPISMLCTGLMAMRTTCRRNEGASPVQLESVPKTEQLHRGCGGTPKDHPGDNARKSIWRQRNEPRRTTFPEQPNSAFFHLGRVLQVRQEPADLRPAPQTASP